ncbi:MAG: phosphatase, partial [Bacteroidota bacterium]
EGKDVKADWQKMERWIEDQIDPKNDKIIAVGTGGNINKLFNISIEKLSENSMSITELLRLQKFVASYSLADRINKLRLNADRADVIVPAAQIYLSAMQKAGATEIIVPDLGLKDGMIKMIYERMLARKR